MRSAQRTARTLVACATLLSTLGLSRPSNGQREACVESYETAQEERLKNELLESRKRLHECEKKCPSPFRDQCSAWKSEIESYLSSIVLRVVDSSGDPVRVTAAYADARPFDAAQELFLIPGEHVIHVEIGGEVLEKRVTTKAREHGLVVDLTRVAKAPPKRDTTGLASLKGEPTKVPSIVALGIGGASLVGSAVLTLYGHVRRSDLESSCAPRCDPALATPISTAWWLAGGLAVVGAFGLVAGWILWPSASRQVAGARGDGAFELRF